MLSNFNESLLPVEFGNLKNCAMIYTLLLFTCIENLLLTDKCAQIPTSCYCKEKHWKGRQKMNARKLTEIYMSPIVFCSQWIIKDLKKYNKNYTT